MSGDLSTSKSDDVNILLFREYVSQDTQAKSENKYITASFSDL